MSQKLKSTSKLLKKLDQLHSAPGVAQGILRMTRDPEKGGEVFMRLLGHTISQPNEGIRRIFIGQFKNIVPRFITAINRCLEHLDAEDVFWRFMFMIGSMAHTMSLSRDLPIVSRGICKMDDEEQIIARLVPFICGGMRAAAPVFDEGK